MNGNLTKVSAADRTLVSNSYKAITTTDEDGEEDTSYITSGITYGNGNKYTYTYDSKNENITGITIDGTLAYEMTYDEDDNMTKQVDRINNVTYTYQYDSDGNVTAVSGSDGFSIVYTNEESTTSGTTTSNGTIKYSDTTSNVQKLISYTSTSTDTSINNTTVLIDGAKVKYIANDNKNTETTTITNTEDKTVVTMSIVKDGRTTTVTNQAGTSTVYKFDKNNNIKSITKDDKEVASYTYDGLEQLIRENDATSNKTYTYKYDKGGNISSKKTYAYTTGTISTDPVDTITYKYSDSNWKDLLTSYNGQTITYDEVGNPLQYRDGMNFTWKNGRSLATATTSAGDNISYQYNKDGIRTSKTVNGTTTKYQLEDNDIVKETTGNNEIWYLYDENKELLGLNINGVSYYYEKNLQGDVVGLVDNQGNTVATYSYDAWGNTTKVTGDKTLAKQNPFRYRSYYYDEEIGLYYLQSRYYDSQVGRFINADDVNVMAAMQKGLKGSNLFEYCENNSVNKIDANGKSATIIITGIGIKIFLGLLGTAAVLEIYRTYKNTKARIKKLNELVKISKKIPNYLKTKDGRVDLKKFNKNKRGKKGKSGPKGWWIEKDYAEHNGSVWKLFNHAGKRIASLWEDGSIRGK